MTKTFARYSSAKPACTRDSNMSERFIIEFDDYNGVTSTLVIPVVHQSKEAIELDFIMEFANNKEQFKPIQLYGAEFRFMRFFDRWSDGISFKHLKIFTVDEWFERTDPWFSRSNE